MGVSPCFNTFCKPSITFRSQAYWAIVPVTLRDTAISLQAFSNRLRIVLQKYRLLGGFIVPYIMLSCLFISNYRRLDCAYFLFIYLQ